MKNQNLPCFGQALVAMRLALWAVFLLLPFAGCDKVKEIAQQVEDEATKAVAKIESPADGESQNADGGSATDSSDSKSAPATTNAASDAKSGTDKAPAPMTPQEVIDAMLSKRPQDISNDDLAQLGQLEEGFDLLPRLELQESKVTAEGLAHILKFQGLKELVMENTNLGLDEVEQIAKFENLELLDADRNGQFNDDCLAIICGMPSLKHLHVSGTGLTDEGLKHLAQAEQLEGLHLNQMSLNGNSLPLLPALKELEVMYTSFGEQGMPNVGRLKSLEIFRARQAQIKDENLLPLKKCVQLRELNLSENPYLTGREFAKLKGLRNLEIVGLYKCLLLDNQALNTLSVCKSLKELDVRETMITGDATQRLKAEFCPDVKIQQ